MIRLIGLLLSVIMIMACYPLGTFQGPEVLPEGKESVGIGLSWMTNINTFQDSSSGNESAFFADGSLLFRRGLAYNTEIGLKFVGRPWINGFLLADVKWQIRDQAVQVAVDFGISYWSRLSLYAFVGYHPAIIVGHDNFFVVGQYNYVRSQVDVLRTQDLILGRHFKLKDSEYQLTPLFGLHRSEGSPENVFYSLGLGFSRPLNDRSIRH